MKRELATMITTTTYGTWLPGDARGYVDRGVIFPKNPPLEEHARKSLKKSPVFLTSAQQETAFTALTSACDEFGYRLHSVAIESWHLHWLVSHNFERVAPMVGRLKNRIRQALDIGRLWTTGYNDQACWTEQDLANRWAYIQRHSGWRPLPNEPNAIP